MFGHRWGAKRVVADLARSWVVLVSARDPSAAHALVPVLRQLASLSNVSLYTVAQSPAYEIFRKEALNVVHAQSSPVDYSDEVGAVELLTEARQILGRVKPDVLLAGLSSPGIGIDEALLASAGDIPSYSIQDPPGYIVPGFDSRARTQFISGIEFLEKAETARCIDIGPPQVERYRTFQPEHLAQQWRRAMGCRGKTAVLFGQPLNNESGYHNSLRSAVSVLGDLVDPMIDHVVYRAHPKERKEDRANTLAALNDATGTMVLEDPLVLPVEGPLCGCDLAISCYSTISTDLVYLNRVAKDPLGGAVHLLFDSDMVRLCAVGGLKKGPWSVQHGFAQGVHDASQLPFAFRTAASLNERRACWERARALVVPDRDPSSVIVDTILSDLSQGYAQ